MKASTERIYQGIIAVCLLCLGALGMYAVQVSNQEPDALGSEDSYRLLDPSIARISIGEFERHQSQVRVSYMITRELVDNITQNKSGNYSVFFEDLTSGAVFGINEKREYSPKSMFKVPTAVAVLKAIEDDELSFNTTVVLRPEMLDREFGDLYRRGVGAQFTVEELLYYSMVESDNTANLALRSTVPFEKIERARLALGVPFPLANASTYVISPKNYASVFRSLYLSGYLRRPYSEYLLNLLTNSDQDNLLRAGVPEEIIVAHKIGEDSILDLYHDCGIVYHPQRPYLLCIMTQAPPDEAEATISQISAAVYQRVSLPPPHLR